MQKLVLASGSPRRKALLETLGAEFKIKCADIDETPFLMEKPSDYVLRLARQKCHAVLECSDDDTTVIGADTTVVIDERIIGKPQSEQEAVDILMALSNRRHKVLTAVCIANHSSQKSILVESNVYFSLLTKEMCSAYWKTGEPQDKAGAYGIQGKGARFVTKIEGSYSSIVGLPMAETAELLSEFNIAYWLY